MKKTLANDDSSTHRQPDADPLPPAEFDSASPRPNTPQELAGHTSLSTTQRYIQGDTAAKRRVVDL
jgi:hypothetical protein